MCTALIFLVNFYCSYYCERYGTVLLVQPLYMLLQLAGFIFDCTCIILPKPIVHIDNYCYLYYSTLFIPFTALYFILHLSYTLKKGHFENKPFIHSFIHPFILQLVHHISIDKTTGYDNPHFQKYI